MSSTRKRTKPEPNIGSSLNSFIADSYVLLAKTQSCHWNATGPNFYGFHKLTEAQYTELFAAIDLLAERSRALQVTAPMSLGDMLHLATLDEAIEVPTIDEATRMLAEDHASMAARAREMADEADEADDAATHDLLVARVLAHEKAAWMLNSHLA
jgi:starvation-inducible DNA-binding protein